MLYNDMIRVKLSYSMGHSPTHILNLKDIKSQCGPSHLQFNVPNLPISTIRYLN